MDGTNYLLAKPPATVKVSKDIAFVIPLFNEEKVFDKLVTRIDAIKNSVEFSIEVILVDDGSCDSTAQLMKQLSLKDASYKSVFLARNYGHQLAVSAGMRMVSSQSVMILDGDLQDPPELVTKFYQTLQQGYDVVYGVRRKRKENVIKKAAYWGFYRLLNKISEINIPLDSGDFCMISKKVNDIIVAMPEQSRFLRGMRTWVGFKQIGIEYERSARQGGESKYNFRMLFKLAYDGIFNFSDIPLRLITKLGMVSICLSFFYLIYILIAKFFFQNVPQGFTTLIFAIILFSGVQLISLGIIGEYVSRIYKQVRNRPLFIIKSVIEDQQEKKEFFVA